MMGWSVRHQGELVAWFRTQREASEWAASQREGDRRWGDRVHVREAAPGDVAALEQARTALLNLRGALAQERCRSVELERQVREMRELIADYADTERKLYAEIRALDRASHG